MLNLPLRVVILDIECTTWEGAVERNWSGSGELREVVELGAILIETKHFSELSCFHCLVKPTINPELSDYFVKLTGITQQDVDERGIEFPLAFNMLKGWSVGHTFLTFESRIDGSRLFDRDVLVENCMLHGIPFLPDSEWMRNVNLIFQEHGYSIKQSGESPKAFGIPTSGRLHNVMDDIRAVITTLKALTKQLSHI